MASIDSGSIFNALLASYSARDDETERSKELQNGKAFYVRDQNTENANAKNQSNVNK
jgi:hypothetical protein